MEQATKRLTEAEESALDHQKRAIRDPSTAHQSDIYPVGSEYALCHAETQLMSAVVAVLNESLTESLRGFYKLRKAFGTLYEISEAERRYLEKKGKTGSAGSSTTSVATGSAASGTTLAPSEGSGVLTPKTAEEEDDDLDFVDADEGHSDVPTPIEYQGHLDPLDLSKMDMSDTKTAALTGDPATATQLGDDKAPSQAALAAADNDVDFRTVTTDPVDLFIHSGTALCYGLLQLMLSMIPPTFAKLLSLFSFRGDRKNGLRLLWSATKFKHNINGGMASLITLGFHNGAIALCDVLASDALPRERLRQLLSEMRELYPQSKLWILEEARMLSGDHKLSQAVEITKAGTPSPLKQVEALRTFERSLNLMYLHRYEECANSFLKCIELNNWSHGLYYYIAGSCYVELYRLAQASDVAAEKAKAETYAKKAEEFMNIVPQHLGKKKFMARQLPFDTFVGRKLAKWHARADERKCSFVDAIGVSPINEMCYFWSGYTRMAAPELEDSLARLAWSRKQPTWSSEPADEKAICSLLTGTCQRFLGNISAAKRTLEEGALQTDMAALRLCPHPDTWPAPVAHYEMAVCLWDEAGGEKGDRAGLKACSDELTKVERAEGYDLDARVGLKVTTARETLRRFGIT